MKKNNFHLILPKLSIGAVVAEWIRRRTSIPEVPGSNPSPAVVPLGKALYPHCLVPRKGLKAVGPLVAYNKAAYAFLVAR